jgi:hypothetical protein
MLYYCLRFFSVPGIAWIRNGLFVDRSRLVLEPGSVYYPITQAKLKDLRNRGEKTYMNFFPNLVSDFLFTLDLIGEFSQYIKKLKECSYTEIIL